MTCPAPRCGLVRGHGVRHAEQNSEAAPTWVDLRPTTSKAEIHLTYACDLDCSCCNRASFLRKPHTPPMTVDDLHEFFWQCDAIGWHPILTFVGGEPTLHPQYEEFLQAAVVWAGKKRVQVWSNGYRGKARDLLKLTRRAGASTARDTLKPRGSVRKKAPGEFWVDDV